MMLIGTAYGIVDGFFVSNFVGKTPFAALNLVMPFLMAVASLGFLVGSGGSAMIAFTMGQGKKQKSYERT